MKKYVLMLSFFICCSVASAQKPKNITLEQRLAVIEDRIALKNLVDTISVLADVKDVKTQLLLFTENAEISSFSDGQPGSTITGRQQIGSAFSTFLAQFQTVYHINGQQTLILNGNKAAGISYCEIVLISLENGKKNKSTMGVIYHDEYVKEKGRWLINKRQSNFTWIDEQPLLQ